VHRVQPAVIIIGARNYCSYRTLLCGGVARICISVIKSRSFKQLQRPTMQRAARRTSASPSSSVHAVGVNGSRSHSVRPELSRSSLPRGTAHLMHILTEQIVDGKQLL